VVCGRQDRGIKLVAAYWRQHGADFISLMPTKLYGPGDNYHPEHSHVLAALIRRFHEAKLASSRSVTVWGTGQPRREFLAVDDLADACVFALKHYSSDGFFNVGAGCDITIADFAKLVANAVGHTGDIVFDTSRPDGTSDDCARLDGPHGNSRGPHGCLQGFSRWRRPSCPLIALAIFCTSRVKRTGALPPLGERHVLANPRSDFGDYRERVRADNLAKSSGRLVLEYGRNGPEHAVPPGRA
jgi:hypothetical protein